jgi:hypothetical protein
MEITLEMSPQLCLFGFNFFWADEEYPYNEINLYFFVLNIKFTWE